MLSLALTLLLLSYMPGQANAEIPIARANGIYAGGLWVGSYSEDGHTLYCVSPTLRLDAGQPFKTVSRLPGINATTTQEVAYVLGQWGTTTNNYQAAAVRLAVLKLLHVSFPQAGATPSAVRAGAAKYVSAAEKYRGPYVLSLKLGTQALVGQTGTATVSVTSAAHAGVPGIQVSLKGVNAGIPSSVRTGRDGKATIHFVRIGTGFVHLYAQARTLVSTLVVSSLPTPGQQHLLGGSVPVSESASLAYQLTPGGPTVTYTCSSACDGKPAVSVEFCHPAQAAAAEYLVYDNGHVVSTTSVSRNSAQQCKTVTVVIPDTHAVSFAVKYHVGRKWTGTVTLPGGFTVDCPPWPTVSASLSCNCTSGSIQLSLPANTTGHAEEIVYSVNGGPQQTSVSQPGSLLTLNIPFTRTTATTVTYTGAIQRANGQWITPPALTLTVPASE